RRLVAKDDVAAWQRLVAGARGIDPHPLRDRIPAPWPWLGADGQPELRAMLASIDVRAAPPTTILLVGLPELRPAARRLRLLRDAQVVYPEDFWLNYQLGAALHEAKDRAGAVRFLTVAVTLRPKAAAAHNALGVVLTADRQLDEAIRHYHKAIDLDPNDA